MEINSPAYSAPSRASSDEETSPATSLPFRVKPVTLARKLTRDAGMQEENHDWFPYLADGVGKRCVGRDPMSIPIEVLTASGHPPRRTRRACQRIRKGGRR